MKKSFKLDFKGLKNLKNISSFHIKLTSNQNKIILITIVILIIILIFIKKIHHIIEKIIVFAILFLLFLIISKNILITIIGSILIFLIINLTMNYTKTIESFQDVDKKIPDINDVKIPDLKEIIANIDSKTDIKTDSKEDTKASNLNISDLQKLETEPGFAKNIFDDDNVKKSAEGIQKLLKQVNGGIELKDEDLKETPKLNVDHAPYSNDNVPNPLKIAQKEAFQLIDTVSALNDTLTTLSPVLSEGKKLMDMFNNFQI
jgi:hypothetical protein